MINPKNYGIPGFEKNQNNRLSSVGGWLYPSSGAYFKLVLAILALLFFVAALSRPYVTEDALIYSMIGRAIYEKGIMPFEYVFDHKPVVTYYIYGLFALIFPDDIPKYQLISLIGYGISAWLTKRFSKKEDWLTHFLVITALSIQSFRFSANTELFFSPLALVSVLLVFANRQIHLAFVSGILGALAFNINYLAAFSIGPTVLYVILSGSGDTGWKIKRLAMYFFGFCVGCFAILLPLQLGGENLVYKYFASQFNFYHGYHQLGSPRPFWHFLMKSLPLFALLIASVQCDENSKKLRNCLILMCCFAYLGAFSSGQYLDYYLYPMVLPLTVLWAISTYAHKHAVAIICIGFLAALSVSPYVHNIGALRNIPAAYEFSQFRRLKAITGTEKVLSIRAHQGILYFAHAEPSQPYLWPNHAEILFGPNEDNYFLKNMSSTQDFVLTRADLCLGDRPTLIGTCDELAAHYTQVLRIEGDEQSLRAILFKRNDGKDTLPR